MRRSKRAAVVPPYKSRRIRRQANAAVDRIVVTRLEDERPVYLDVAQGRIVGRVISSVDLSDPRTRVDAMPVRPRRRTFASLVARAARWVAHRLESRGRS